MNNQDPLAQPVTGTVNITAEPVQYVAPVAPEVTPTLTTKKKVGVMAASFVVSGFLISGTIAGITSMQQNAYHEKIQRESRVIIL